MQLLLLMRAQETLNFGGEPATACKAIQEGCGPLKPLLKSRLQTLPDVRAGFVHVG
jgi:hypothetical protein